MEKKQNLKLTLYRDYKEIRTIIEPNTDEKLNYILEVSEKWKREDTKRNTIRFSIEWSYKHWNIEESVKPDLYHEMVLKMKAESVMEKSFEEDAFFLITSILLNE